MEGVAMRTEPRRGPGRHAGLVAACLLAVFGSAPGTAGQEPSNDAAKRVAPESFRLGDTAGARAIEPLLARLWASGFFRKNEAVLREILNNDYGFFGPDSPSPPAGSKGWGCFSRRAGGRDAIFLRKDLFAHFAVGMDETTFCADVGSRALAVLIHELCHDLWTNVLDGGERAAFAREGEAFMRDFRRAQTSDEVRRFLAVAGDDPADPRCLRSYSGISEILAANPTRALCGHEMFAWLAERLFMTKNMIPGPLRKYYASILADGPPAGRSR
jgi:hypothetical protein